MSDGEDEGDERKSGKLVEGRKHNSTAMKRKGYNNIDHKPVANIKYIHRARRTCEWSPIRKATGSGVPKSSNLGVKHQLLAFLFMIDESCIVPISSLCYRQTTVGNPVDDCGLFRRYRFRENIVCVSMSLFTIPYSSTVLYLCVRYVWALNSTRVQYGYRAHKHSTVAQEFVK